MRKSILDRRHLIERPDEKCKSSSFQLMDREGEGWETASEGEEKDNTNSVSKSATEDNFEDALTEEEQQQRELDQANSAKAEGNNLYVAGKYKEALECYASALELVSDHTSTSEVRSMCLSNRAMCYLQLGEYEEAIQESTKALELNSNYVKAIVRRAQAHEKLDHLEEALSDMKKALELDAGNKEALKSVRHLEPIVAEKREKMKEEMIAKLKGLGNSILGRFGMSVDNFKAVQDPQTGSYSLSFQR